jgi:hypothetical protein
MTIVSFGKSPSVLAPISAEKLATNVVVTAVKELFYSVMEYPTVDKICARHNFCRIF